jgi:predicted TIM-barrel fold metal-dependent hydrolase
LALQNENPGTLLTFAAYDPFRREESVATAKDAYDRGVIGFKFYPPSGYRPAQNEFPSRDRKGTVPEQWDSRYAGTTAAQLDKTNDEFFAFCEARHVPIFVHCTPEGFESVPSYGSLMCDPVYWTNVFLKYPKLRVCFGHSGGTGLWFNETNNSQSTEFGKTIIQLCTNVNVYCDAGYWQSVLSEEGLGKLKQQLPQLLSDFPHMKQKLIYGSDWFMISTLDDYQSYLCRMAMAINAVPDKQFKIDFFGGNAARYLNVNALWDDPRLPARARASLADLMRSYTTH